MILNKKVLLSLLLALTLTVSVASATVSNTSLVGYYDFESNTVFPNKATTNNNGTFLTAPGMFSGKIGNSLLYSGVVGQYITLSEAGDVFDWGDGNFSINYWGYVNSSAKLVPFSRTGTGCEAFLILTGSVAYGSSGSCWNIINAVSMGTDQPGKWVMYTAIRDSGRFLTYINATLISNVSISGTLLSSAADVHIHNYVNDYTTGGVDELSIWKGRAINGTEITSLWNDGTGLNLSNWNGAGVSSSVVNVTGFSYLTSGGDVDSSLAFGDVLSTVSVRVNDSQGRNLSVRLQVSYPDGSVVVNNVSMSNVSTLYSASLGQRLDRTGVWTLSVYANNSNGDVGTNSTTFTVSLLANSSLADGFNGFDTDAVLNSGNVSSLLNYNYNLLGFRVNFSGFGGNWTPFLSAINVSFVNNAKSFLKLNFVKGNYSSSSAECSVINGNFSNLTQFPYSDGLAFIVVQVNNSGVDNVSRFVNEVSACMVSTINNAVPIYTTANVSVNPDYVTPWSMVRQGDQSNLALSVASENLYLRNTSSLTRIWNGSNSTFQNWTKNYYLNVLGVLRSSPLGSGQPVDSRIAKLSNGDLIFFNSGSSSNQSSNFSVVSGNDLWNVNKKELFRKVSGLTNLTILIDPVFASVLFVDNFSRFVLNDNLSSTLYRSSGNQFGIMNYLQNGTTDATLSVVGAYDARVELWNPDLGFSNLAFVTYEQLEYVQIVNFSRYPQIIIAKTNTSNNASVVNVSLEVSKYSDILNKTFGYISVADYNNSNLSGGNISNCSEVNAWETFKIGEADDWISNYSTNVFIDGFDIGYSSTPGCFEERIKRVGDHIRLIRGKKTIFNTYTIYQSVSNFGDFLMRESCFSRWNGTVGSPTYSYEDVGLMVNNSNFARVNNKPVICMAFGDVNDYDKLSFDYHAFAVFYGLKTGSGLNNSFRYGQPNFQTQREIRVPTFGSQLQSNYDSSNPSDWWRRYGNGVVHVSPYRNYTFPNGEYYWFDDGKTVNNLTITGRFQVYGSTCSASQNIYIVVNDNVTKTIDECADVGASQFSSNFVTKDFTTSYEANGHYYVRLYPVTRGNPVGMNVYNRLNTLTGVHSWYDGGAENPPDSEAEWTAYGRSGALGDFNTTNYQFNISLNYTTSASVDSSITKINQSVVVSSNTHNLSLRSAPTYNLTTWSNPYTLTTSKSNITAFLGTTLLNVSTNDDCTGNNPTFNVLNPGGLGACRKNNSGTGWAYRFSATDLLLTTSFLINDFNTVPTAPTSLNLTPLNLTFLASLTANASGGTDGDGEAVSYLYEFYNLNDTAIRQALGATATYTNVLADLGDVLRVRARSFDGTDNSSGYAEANISVSYNLPSISAVTILPATVFFDELLNCTGVYLSNYSEANSSFKWFKNGALIINETTRLLNASGNSTIGDLLKCEYTPSDGFFNGTSVNSSQVTVQSRAPVPSPTYGSGGSSGGGSGLSGGLSANASTDKNHILLDRDKFTISKGSDLKFSATYLNQDGNLTIANTFYAKLHYPDGKIVNLGLNNTGKGVYVFDYNMDVEPGNYVLTVYLDYSALDIPVVVVGNSLVEKTKLAVEDAKDSVVGVVADSKAELVDGKWSKKDLAIIIVLAGVVLVVGVLLLDAFSRKKVKASGF